MKQEMVTIPAPYKVQSIVSSRTNSQVLKCIDSQTGNYVGLKVWLSSDDEIGQSSSQQYDFLSRVNHPYIVKLFGIGVTEEGYPYHVVEWATDGDIGEKSLTLSPKEKLALTVQITEALDLLHSIGYIHGDIKPSNVLLTRSQTCEIQVKLTDFEFLRPGSHTKTKDWRGTLPYMSPEVIRGEPVGYSSDLYSLGILIFQFFTGRLPFNKENVYRIAYAQLDEEPELNEDEKNILPSILVSSVFSLLQKNPIERIDSAWKLRDALLQDNYRIREADMRLSHSLFDFYWRSEPVQNFSSAKGLSSLLIVTFPGLNPDIGLVNYLLSKSGGDSEIIKKYLLGLLDEGMILRERGCWTLRDNFESLTLSEHLALSHLPCELSVLSPESKKLLEIVSVFKYEADSEVLKGIPGFDPFSLENSLAMLADTQWLVLDDNSNKKVVRFCKGIDRDFILQGIDHQSLLCMRRLVIDILQDRLTHDDGIVLKELLYQAEEIQDKLLTYRYARMLSEWANTRNGEREVLKYAILALENSQEGSKEMAELFLRVADIYDEQGQPRDAANHYLRFLSSDHINIFQVSSVERKLGWCYVRLADLKKAEKYLTSSIERSRSQGNLQVEASALLDLAAANHHEKDYNRCNATLAECQEVIKDWEPCDKQARLYNLRGILDWSQGNYQASYDSYQKSYEIYQDLGLTKELGRVANNLAILLRDWGKYDQALQYMNKDMELAAKLGDQMSLCSSYINLALIHQALRKFEQGIHFATQALELAEKLAYKLGEAVSHNNLGFLYLSEGALDQSLFHLRQAALCCKELNNQSQLSQAYFNLGELYRMREMQGLAKESYHRSLVIRRKTGEKLGIADTLAGLSKLSLEMLDFEECDRYLPESLTIYKELGKEKEEMLLLLSQAEALCRDKRMAEAELILSQILNKTKEARDSQAESYRNLVQGLIDSEKNDPASAESNLLRALQWFRTDRNKAAQAKAALFLGELHSSLDRTRLSTKFWRESLGLYRELRVIPKVEKLEKLMGEIDRTSRRDREQLQTLSRVNQLLLQIEDEEELLNEVLRLAIELLGAERGAIIFYDEQRSTFEVRVSCALEQDTAKDALEISRKTVQKVQQTGKTFIAGDASSEAALKDHPSVRTYNILSILCAPLRVDDKVIGTIYLDNRTLTRAFSEEDRDFIDVLSSLIAVAISKAQRYTRAFEEIHQLKQRTEKVYGFPNIIGRSPRMQEVFAMVSKVAPTKATVLIQGESGTGKELIANLIYSLSDRKEKPFIRVNCAAIPDSLLESELFGVEERVATGVTFREGKFKQADGGTIFLDEIGDMNLATQAKVLRVLQEREFERVGGSKTIKVDIRLISATNKDLDKLIIDKNFRPDLYYRLNTVTIPLPNLRDRKEEIPFLIEHFLKKYSEENHKPELKIASVVVRALYNYDWPGNVRELMNIIERGVIFAEKGEFDSSQLPTQVSNELQSASVFKSTGKLRNTLARVEKQIVEETLRQTDWHQAKAARRLGIPESTLIRKIRLHKIRKPQTL